MNISASQLSQAATLMSACGAKWSEAAYGMNQKDAVIVNWGALASDIVDACTAAGPYTPARLRGAGIWEDNGRLVVNSDELWTTDGSDCDRVNGDYVYQCTADVGIKPGQESATQEEAQELLAALETWNWKRKSDSLLMYGWIAHSFLSGALSWRTHANLTGAAGTGKSTLLRMIQNIYGNYLLLADGDSTEAGIRQKLGSSSRPVVIDEGEADSSKIHRILQMLRSASSGSGVLRGTQDQAGTEFTLRSCGLVAGIVPPQLNGADSTRFIRVELDAQPKISEPHRLISDDDIAGQLGKKLWMRMLLSWNRFNLNLKAVRLCMQLDMDSSRAADTIGTVIAAAYTLLKDDVLTIDTARDFMSTIDLVDMKTAQKTDDSGDCLTYILSMSVRTSNGNSTVATLASQAAADGHKSQSAQDLGLYGIRADVEEDGPESGKIKLGINSNAPGLIGLLKGTRWESGALRVSMLRLKGASAAHSTTRIGGVACKPVFVFADIQTVEPSNAGARLAAVM